MNPDESITLVWFKRDLRLSEHEPLARAAELRSPVLPLFIFEPWKLDALGLQEAGIRLIPVEEHLALDDTRRVYPLPVVDANDSQTERKIDF